MMDSGISFAVHLELRRIGLPRDSKALWAMGYSGPARDLPSPAEVLFRLHALPVGASGAAVDAALLEPPAFPNLDSRDLVDFTIFSNALTLRDRMHFELARIAPVLPPGMCLDYPGRRRLTACVEALNAVPDDAGFEAFARVLVAHGGVTGRLTVGGEGNPGSHPR